VSVVLLIEGVIGEQALADTWCSTSFPNAVFCDDFDGYPDGGAFYDEWIKTGPCSSELSPDTDYYSSAP
jgi:hypothetical protein